MNFMDFEKTSSIAGYLKIFACSQELRKFVHELTNSHK